MLTYICNGGRLGENISFIYGLFRFAKINKIPFTDICLSLNYKNIKMCIDDENQYVFRENFEMFSNIQYIFKENIDLSNFEHVNLQAKTDLAQLYEYYKINKIEPNTNICFSNWWSLDNYWLNRDLKFDFKLLNFICRPQKVVDRLFKKYKNILTNSVAIHIRRCDYKAIQNNNILKNEIKNNFNLYFKNKIYYSEKDINQILISIDRTVYNNIIVFSDDVDWCIQKFNNYDNIYFIKNQKPYEDMIMMSLCNKIIENPGSFFSHIPLILQRYNKLCLKN